MKVVPTKYIREDEILTNEEVDVGLVELREQIKNSPDCDHYFFEHRDEIVAKHHADWDEISSHKDSSNKVSCPYCSSSNVNKIGMAGRLISVGLFGLGSKKIGKQWHCKNCGSDF